ncbi:transglutaminase-like cysteine peptidase [Caulobacter sp. KR2-114]|uniref:transglutaminase-like cysteine peptidase n=1 Tax=Caulobacter sp. KR2-114 TaxID=3400912 RepID=UPI003C0E0556
MQAVTAHQVAATPMLRPAIDAHPASAPAAPAVTPPQSRLAQVEQRQQVAPPAEAGRQDDQPAAVTRISYTPPAAQTPVRPHSFSPAPPATQEPGAPNLFGSVALAVSHTAEDSQWRRVVDSRLPDGQGPWTRILDRARGLPLLEQLQVINAGVNQAVTFTSDIQQYGVDDYWATARETLTSGRGDCEDFAIAKLQLLEALGVSPDSLYLVVARDLDRQADHAVLAVRAQGRFWILDSAAGVMTAESVRDYRPILTFSARHAWVHGYRRAPDVMMASAGEVGGAH